MPIKICNRKGKIFNEKQAVVIYETKQRESWKYQYTLFLVKSKGKTIFLAFFITVFLNLFVNIFLNNRIKTKTYYYCKEEKSAGYTIHDAGL